MPDWQKIILLKEIILSGKKLKELPQQKQFKDKNRHAKRTAESTSALML
jgi:hypothetical protein